MQDQKEIDEKFPFFTMITSGGHEYFGIVQNQDNAVTFCTIINCSDDKKIYIFSNKMESNDKYL